MNKISDRTNATVVKIFINSLTVISFMTAPFVAYAQTTPPAPTNYAENPEIAQKRICKEYTNDIRDAEEKISTACRKAGMGGGKACVDKARDCDSAMDEDSYDDTGSLTKSLAGLMGGNIGNLASTALGALGKGDTNSSCPQMSGRSYFEKKEKIEADLNKVKEDIAKLDEERGDAKKEYDEAVKTINEALSKKQEEAKEDGHGIDEDTQKQITEFQTSQAKAAQSIRDQKDSILSLQGQLTNLDRQKAASLIELTNYTAQIECKGKMNAAYAAYKTAVSAGTSSLHITKAKAKKKELINIYNKCMEGWEQKRIATNEQYRDQRAQLARKVENATANIASIEDGLSKSEDTLNTLKKTAETKKSEKLQAVIALGEQSQQELKAAYELLQTKTNGINKKEAAYNEKMNNLSNQLMTLGPAPKNPDSDYAPDDALSDIDSGITRLDSIMEGAADCPQVKKSAEKIKKAYGGR